MLLQSPKDVSLMTNTPVVQLVQLGGVQNHQRLNASALQRLARLRISTAGTPLGVPAG